MIACVGEMAALLGRKCYRAKSSAKLHVTRSSCVVLSLLRDGDGNDDKSRRW